MTVTLEGGWNLTQLGTKVDTKVPEMITALTEPLPKEKAGVARETVLYRIIFDPTTGVVSGLQEIPFR
jgi:hypothetical protein